MNRAIVVAVALLALSLGFLRSSVYAADGDADDKAVRDVAKRFFAAYAAKDLDAFMALWSEKSPEYEARKKEMAELFAVTGPIQRQFLEVKWARRDGDAASARVRWLTVRNDATTGKPQPSFRLLDVVLEFARQDGGWKVMRIHPPDRWLMGRLAAAASKVERLHKLDDDSDLVGPDFVDLILKSGDALSKRGKFEDAERLEDLAFEAATGLGDLRALARCHWYRAEDLANQGDGAKDLEIQKCYVAALISYQTALQLCRKANDGDGEATTLHNMGIVLEKTASYKDALRHFQDGLKIDRDLKNRAAEAETLVCIGNVYRLMGHPEESLRQYQDGLKIYRETSDPAGEVAGLLGIGVVYDETGRYAEALRHFQDGLKIARDGGDRAGEARFLQDIGNVYTNTGRYAEALRQFQDGLTIQRDLHDLKAQAETLNNIGKVYWLTGSYFEALRQFRDSLKVRQEMGDPTGGVPTIRNMAFANVAAGNYAEAQQRFQDLLQIERDLGDRAGEAATLIGIGDIYRFTARYAEALRKYQDGITIERDLGDRAGEARSLDAIGGVHQAQKHWAQAVLAYEDAVRVVEQIRADVREPSLESSFLGGETGPYFRLSQCLLEQDKGADAFAAGERMKARGLVDILRDGKADLRRGMSDDERKQEQQLQDRLTVLGVQWANLHTHHANNDQQAAAKSDLAKARQDLEAFRRDLYLHRPDLVTRRAEFASASFQELGGTLFAGRPGLVVLSYLVGEKETLLFVLTAAEKDGGPARLTVHRIDKESKELAEAVAAFRDACSDPGKGEPDSADLYHWLVAPAADQLTDARQFVVIGDGVLNTLPFHALRDPDGKYLIERFAVSYAPSATALAKMEELGAKRRTQYADHKPSLLAVGISDFGRREKTLPAAEKEARAVAAAFGTGAKLLAGEEATRAKLEAAWSGRRWLHFATHGRLNPDAPLYSSLVLSTAGAGDEGVLYANDLLNADIPAELVVMSACHTGEGRHVAGEGLLGMSWAWFAAGVPSTVASQWSVGDDSTARLMKAFYARLAAGDSKAEALRQAELTLLRDPATRHPFYWAPFVLVGDDR